MKKILFTWELGGGLGHILHIKKLAGIYLEMGHEVYVALMDLTYAGKVFSGMDVKLLQAPYKTGHRENPIMPPLSFSQLLHNNGFSTATELDGLVKAWVTLYELVQPDIIFFDHCPSALVAARKFDCLKVTIGVGFSSPPKDSSPFGVFTEPCDKQKMLQDDERILANINEVLENTGGLPMKTLSDLLYDNVKTCFLSLPEFDHFCERDKSLYYGPVMSETGVKPVWPQKKYKKKVYVYLKQFAGIAQLFKIFAKYKYSFIVYTNNVPEDIINASQADNISFLAKPLDLSIVCKQADLAIVNAGHSTLCQFVLAGVPVLMVPLQMEQQMLAVRMYNQQVGWISDTEMPNFFQSVEQMLTGLKKGLPMERKIKNRYAKYNFTAMHKKMCHEIIDIASRNDAK